MHRRRSALVALGVLLAACASASPTPVPSATPPGPTPIPTAAPAVDARGCPLDQEGNLALATQLDRSLTVQGATGIALTTAAIGARNQSWGADDAIPGFATLDLAATPVGVARGGSLTIGGSEGMQLRGGDMKAWQRSQLTVPAGGGRPDVAGAAVALDAVARDGALAVTMPDAIDTWVLELHPLWMTDCLVGDGVAYVIVRTR